MTENTALSRAAPRVQVAHGLEGSPNGSKVRLLRSHFPTDAPEMDTADFDACVALHAKRIMEERPDVLVGSSFGGAVVCKLIADGVWTGPTVLLCPAYKKYGVEVSLAGVPTVVVHGIKDEIVPTIDSFRLATSGDVGRVRFIAIDDGHRLESIVSSGELVDYVNLALNLPEWREPAPLAKVLIASQSGVNFVLTAIGRVVEYMESVEALDEWFKDVELGPGIWAVEFHIQSYSYDTVDGREYDEELRIDSIASATREELEAHQNGEWPWDPGLWMSNWQEAT